MLASAAKVGGEKLKRALLSLGGGRLAAALDHFDEDPGGGESVHDSLD